MSHKYIRKVFSVRVFNGIRKFLYVPCKEIIAVFGGDKAVLSLICGIAVTEVIVAAGNISVFGKCLFKTLFANIILIFIY